MQTLIRRYLKNPLHTGPKPMESKTRLLHAYMKRIEELLDESYRLKRTKESWGRHVEIQAEIMSLCRKTADLHDRDTKPYWSQENAEVSNPHSNSKAA